MKKTTLVTGIGIILTIGCIIIAPTISRATDQKLDVAKSTEEFNATQEIDDLELELKKIESDDDVNIAEEERCKEIQEEIAEIEEDYDLFDYKEEIKLRIDTIETAINDMKRDLKRGIPEQYLDDCQNRIRKLSPIVVKYRKLIEQSDMDYEALYEQLDQQLNDIYEELND